MGERDDDTGRTQQQQEPSAIPVPEILQMVSTQEQVIPEDQWVLLCSRPESVAAEICARLEAEGIPARTRQPETTVAAEGGETEIQVPREFAETARGVLSHPEHCELDEEDDTDEEYYIRRWICPSCRVGEIEPKPLPRHWRWVGWTILLMLGIRAFVWLMQCLDRENLEQVASLLDEWYWVWFGMIAVLIVAFVSVLGNKYCPRCGWQLHGGKKA